MMKNILKFTFGLMSFGFLLTGVSCEKYLDDELLSDTSVQFLYNTPEGLQSAVVGLYSINREIYEDASFNYGVPLIPVAKSDLTVGRTAEIAFYARLGWGISPDRSGVAGLRSHFRYGYKLVDRANAIIASAENIPDIDEDLRNQIIAEAKSFRANAYFTLYRQFNNIFLTTERTTPENAFDVPQDRSSAADIFALINADLDFAIGNLDWKPAEFGRWNQGAARHVKMKVAAWQEDWPEASAQADAIINDGTYSLVPNTADVFKGDLNNSETLFAVQYAAATTGGSTLNRIHFNFIPQYDEVPGADFSIANGGRGAGFLLMNNYIRDLLKEDPNDDRDDGTYYITQYRYNDAENLPEGKQLGDVIDLYNQNSSNNSERNNYYKRTNPGTLKYLQEDALPTEANQISNIMVYRLAETYIVGAEAHLKQGDNVTALAYINAIRNRAKAASLSAVTMQGIIEEHARELGFEGQRFYYLKRLGIYVDYLRDHASNEGFFDQARSRAEPFLANWPIPTDELNLLGPNYPQNNGY